MSTQEEYEQEAHIIQQQNIVFADALKRGTITQQQYDEAMRIQKQKIRDTEVSFTEPSRQTTDYLQSMKYWEEAGYPQYVGKYPAPPHIKASKVTGVKETETGLTISYEKPQKQKPQKDIFTQVKEGFLEFVTRPFKPEYQFWTTEYQVKKFTKPMKEMEAYKADPFGWSVGKALETAGVITIAVAPQVGVPSAIIGAGLQTGIETAITGDIPSTEKIGKYALKSAGYGGIFKAGFGVVASIPRIGQTIVTHSFGRAGVSALIGGGTSYVISKGDVESAVIGAGAGASFSLAGDYLISPAIKRIAGVKVTRVVGATEKAFSQTQDDFLAVGRKTTLYLKTERIPYKYAKYLEDMQRYYTPKTMDVAGTHMTLYTTTKPIVTKDIVTGSYQDIGRIADPYISAVKTPQKLGFWASLKQNFGFAPKTATVTQYTVAQTFKPSIVTGTTVSDRSLTVIRFWGDIDKQIYIDLAKNVPTPIAQSFYRQMGGLPLQILERTVKSTVPVFTQIVGISFPKTISTLALTSAVTSLTKPKKPSFKASLSPLMLEPTITEPKTPSLSTRSGSLLLFEPRTVTKPKKPSLRKTRTAPMLSGLEETTPLQFTPPKLRHTPYGFPKMELPSVALIVVPATLKELTKPQEFPVEKTIFEVPLGQPEVLIPDVTQTQVQEFTQTYVIPIPTPPPVTAFPTMPLTAFFPRTGGKAGSRSIRNLFGVWMPRTHKVKTWKQQVETFGLGFGVKRIKKTRHKKKEKSKRGKRKR